MAKSKDTQQMQGTIEKVARNGRAFLIDEEWYSVYKASQANGAEAGDYVEFEYDVVEKGGQSFRNIQGNVTVKGASKTPAKGKRSSDEDTSAQEASQARYNAKDRSITRQNMLRHATAIVTALPLGQLDDVVDDVIATAKRLEEEYINAE